MLPFKKTNIFIILAGVFLIFLGYFLMSLEDFVDATEFSMSLYVSPVLIIAGHVVIGVGIIYREKSPADAKTTPEVPKK